MSNHHNKIILVSGGTGHYGREVVRSLLAKKVRVRVLSRDTRTASEVFPEAARRISAIWREKIIFRKIPMLFPRIAYWLSAPLCLFSDRMLYVHTLLGFIRLLNHFPQSIIPEIPNLHQYLVATFKYRPTTLEMEAE